MFKRAFLSTSNSGLLLNNSQSVIAFGEYCLACSAFLRSTSAAFLRASVCKLWYVLSLHVTMIGFTCDRSSESASVRCILRRCAGLFAFDASSFNCVRRTSKYPAASGVMICALSNYWMTPIRTLITSRTGFFLLWH